jgi:hypothetical protein
MIIPGAGVMATLLEVGVASCFECGPHRAIAMLPSLDKPVQAAEAATDGYLRGYRAAGVGITPPPDIYHDASN